MHLQRQRAAPGGALGMSVNGRQGPSWLGRRKITSLIAASHLRPRLHHGQGAVCVHDALHILHIEVEAKEVALRLRAAKHPAAEPRHNKWMW